MVADRVLENSFLTPKVLDVGFGRNKASQS